MNKLQKRIWIAFLLISIFLLSACGSVQLQVETDEPIDPGTMDEDTPPVDVLVARDTALHFIRDHYGEIDLPADPSWIAHRLDMQGLVGTSSFHFETLGWTMTIAYPVVAPEATIYTIELLDSTSGFQWSGQVDAQGNVIEMAGTSTEVSVVAWAGRIERLAEGAGPNDYFVLIPEGVGAVGIQGSNEELETKLDLAASSNDFVHVWGELACGVDDFNNCRINVERLRWGTEITDAEVIEGWEGVIYKAGDEPRSGGDDYFALMGDFPVQFGLWSMDETLRLELEELCDTQTVIRIWGEITAGIPDWNGTQIRVDRYEVVDAPSGAIPPSPDVGEPDTGWLTYENARYGYRFQYPPTAEIEEVGPQGYPTDENGLPLGGLPDGVTVETYFEYLQETYGNNLCVGVRYSLGYIYISAAENQEYRYALCGRTGVGVAEIIQQEEEIIVDGMTVTASGMEVKGPGESLNDHNETMVVHLPDGTRIEYGAAPRADATYEDYLMKTRATLLQILETFEIID